MKIVVLRKMISSMFRILLGMFQKVHVGYKRVFVGIVFLVLELCLFFGSGVLLEDETHFLSGEGLWDVALGDEAPGITQEFEPSHKKLQSISFRMDLSGLTQWDNEVIVSVTDKSGQVLFERTLDIQEITDCAYTDVEVNLELSTSQKYNLNIVSTPTSAGEYPLISVCSTEYRLPESRSLTHGEEIAGNHLVSRYAYTDGLTTGRALKAILLCLAAALGIAVGLPENNYVRKGVGVALFLAAPYVLGQRLELLTYSESFYLPFAMKWNLLIMYVLELLVLLVTHSTAVSVVLTNVFLTVLYSANYFMLMYRGTSLRMNDLTAIGTATEVVGDYDLTPNSHLAFVWAIAVVFVVFGIQTVKVRKKKEEREPVTARRVVLVALSYVVTIAIAVSIVVVGGRKILYTDYFAEKGFADKAFTGFDYELIYSFNGYLVGTCVELKNSRIVKPEGYSIQRVEEILQSAGNGGEADPELPHVILIMNESLADIRTVADVELSQENMTFLDSMEENTIKGFANVSTFGGGTANAEFEVFTGCTMAFLPVNYYPYQQAMRRPVNSMVSQMEKYGYRTISMHPEPESNWNRKNVYKYYDFDEKLFDKAFAGAEIVHSGVSDAETYKKVIELYENRNAGEKLFLFDLTMQNHAGYDQDDGPDEVQALGINEPELDEFLSLIKVSDEAFAELVHYFEKQDEKVVICMFGDHQPWVFDLIAGTNKAQDSAASELVMDKYRTPFVIWANYDIQEASDCDISLNYLGGLVMKTAGVPLSPYFAYLDELRQEYPILTINGYVDKDGNYNNWSGEVNEFLEYRMLQYNYLFDDQTVDWGY